MSGKVSLKNGVSGELISELEKVSVDKVIFTLFDNDKERVKAEKDISKKLKTLLTQDQEEEVFNLFMAKEYCEYGIMFREGFKLACSIFLRE